jgi:anthranilate/para-aminobenzoate synthase component I
MERARDPFSRFVRALGPEPGQSAFYFERGGSPGRGSRTATFGLSAGERILWREPRDVEEQLDRLREARRRSGPVGGWAGYVGFDAVGLFEPLLLASTPRGSPFPPAIFDRFDRMERCPLRGRPAPGRTPGLPEAPRLGPVRDASSPANYGRSVERLREAIYDGEAFQVVLAHRRERALRGSLLPVVDRLRRGERYAYLYYLRLEDAIDGGGAIEMVGASPESVVEVEGRAVSINPIAGTRPFPPPPTGPRARLPLDKDPKELAEHRMLVDLARNDLGKIAEVGSVRLSRREVRVPYARLEHLVSRVVARLPRGAGALDALRSAFPAGTVSGAPKIRATELLRREERTWRGPYAGAVGLFDDRGDGEFALAIRSAFAVGGKVYTEAGAGIVHLSEPRREWEETTVKLAAIERALMGRPVAQGPQERWR